MSSLTISLPKLCWFKILCTDSWTLCKAGAAHFHYNFFFDFSKNHLMKFNSCMVANPRDNCPVKILVFLPVLSSPLNDTKTTVFRSISIFQKIYFNLAALLPKELQLLRASHLLLPASRIKRSPVPAEALSIYHSHGRP